MAAGTDETMEYTKVSGSICAAKGFLAAGIHCGIRKNKSKRDLALIYSTTPCAAAAVFTTNKVKASPLLVSKAHLADGKIQAVICNSGNANACNADGIDKANATCEAAAKALKLKAEDILVASTGVIGQPLPLEPIVEHLDELSASLSPNGSADAAEAIMTTDTAPKEIAVEFTVGGKLCRMGGIAKGSGMIHPNMGTMLAFVTTDCAIDAPLLQKAVSACVQDTFNMVSVDGDTSTNDTFAVLANGQAGNDPIKAEGTDYDVFYGALMEVASHLAKAIAGDGEGCTHLIECTVTGAPTVEDAKKAAKSVICSSLFKAAIFGADANWGRILCALGYSGAELDPNKVDVTIASEGGSFPVCKNGMGVEFSEEYAKQVLLKEEVKVLVSLHGGDCSAVAWGCDLTYDYVKINGDYRT